VGRFRYHRAWIEKSVENRVIFTKTGETHRFSVNRAVKFDFFKKIEIKIVKELESILRFFCENKIQKFEVTHPTKSEKEKPKGKSREKKENNRFLIRGNHMPLS
jgi:hypothetical protein